MGYDYSGTFIRIVGMTKILPFLSLALFMVGCEAVNNAQPSKPFGISKLKNQPNGEHFMKDIVAEPQPATVVVSPSDEAGLQILRQRYGIPSHEVIKTEDVNAMIRLYTLECLRLQERQK
jgi:hypothetical protein